MARLLEHSWKSSRWFTAPTFVTYREGRFIVVELTCEHRVLTTSSCVGGMNHDIRYLVNHQSCEASGHTQRFEEITKLGQDGYHHAVCGELGLSWTDTAVMGTAANMIYAAHESRSFEDLRVDAIVTAGVEGNAVCAGDPAQWVETPSGWNKLPEVAGTINVIVAANQSLKPEAQVRALITATEAKTAALTELGISSRYSPDLATGTGTDQVCLAVPLIENAYQYMSASPHSKLGELLGKSVRQAVKQALRWQNGLEPSITRSIVHALRRFGFSEQSLLDAMKTRLSEPSMVLFERNKIGVLHEPQVAAAVYAFSAVWDRTRFGVIPNSAARDVLRQQAATMAAALAARSEDWYTFWQQIHVDLDRPLDAIYDAVALGWTAKWRSKD
jgi:adenosylcobinamide hydrolase